MTMLERCPKCDTPTTEGATECLSCGVVFEKYRQIQQAESVQASREGAGRTLVESLIRDAKVFKISQSMETLELLVGFESRNRYRVTDATNRDIVSVTEEKGGFGGMISRLFLSHMRGLTLSATTDDGLEFFRLARPFAFYFSEMAATDSSGRPLCKIARRFALLNRRFDILDPSERVRMTITGPLLKPWTFKIFDREGAEIGVIKKQWSGLLKETFSTADNFQVTVERNLEVRDKLSILSAAFLIDLIHFERKG